ncbi:hypothetical protein MMC13_002841 [Lambiella insularis]|nr:hypothetical protein [Lambiella insularis]
MDDVRPQSNAEGLLRSLSLVIPAPCESIPCPKPQKDLSEYTPERLGTGLVFVTARLRGDISPRSEMVLEEQRDLLERALEETDKEEKARLVSSIQTLDRIISTKDFIRGTDTPESRDLQNTLLELKEVVFLARYGDYVGNKLALLRYNARQKKTPGYEEFSRQYRWQAIADQLIVDKVAKEEAVKQGVVSYQRTTSAIRTACIELGFDPDDMKKAILMYGDRNNVVHAHIKDIVRTCRWGQLAEVLHRDLRDLPHLIPPSRPGDLKMVMATIVDLRKTYFEEAGVYDDDDDSSAWIPSAEARKLSMELAEEKRMEKERKEAKAAQEAAAQQKAKAQVQKIAKKKASVEGLLERASEHLPWAQRLAVNSPEEYNRIQAQIKSEDESKARNRNASTEGPRGTKDWLEFEKAHRMRIANMQEQLEKMVRKGENLGEDVS